MTNLLKPAKDLAENWSIDVAAELTTYLNQLEASNRATGEDEENPMELNFVEAALIKVEYLRALAYETLNNVVSTGRRGINHDGHTVTNATRGYRNNGPKSEEWDISESFYNPWNAVTPGKDISELSTIEEPSTDEIPYIRTAVYYQNYATHMPKWITNGVTKRMPLVLMPRDDRSECRLSSAAIHPTTGSLFVNEQDLFEFDHLLNKQQHPSIICPGTGMSDAILAQPGTTTLATFQQIPLSIDNVIDSQQSGAHVSTMLKSPIPSITADSAARDKNFGTETCFGVQVHNTIGDDGNDLGDDDASGDYFGDSLSQQHEKVSQDNGAQMASTTVDRADRLKQQRHKKAIDPLAKLDCHKPLGRDRPLRVGRTFKPPDPKIYLCSAESLPNEQLSLMMNKNFENCSNAMPSFLTTTNNNEENQCEPNENDSQGDQLLRLKPGRLAYFSDLKCPIFPLADHFHLGCGWRAVESEFMVLKRGEKSTNMLTAIKEKKDSPGFSPSSDIGDEQQFSSNWTFDHDDNDGGDPFDGEGSVNSDNKIGQNEPNNGNNMMEDYIEAEELPNSNDELTAVDIEAVLKDAQSSYAEVLHKRLATMEGSMQNSSNNYRISISANESIDLFTSGISQMELHKRMSKWRARVERWMVKIKKRGPFDVTEYKQKIAKKLLSSSETHSPQNKSLALSKTQTESVLFGDLMKGESRAEVCRYFLTTLLMSNEHLVELCDPNEELSPTKTSNSDEGSALIQQKQENVLGRDFTVRLTATIEDIREGVIGTTEETADEGISTRPPPNRRRMKGR